MTLAQNNENERRHYEQLQKEYQKLATEYKDIESNNPQSLLLSEKINEMIKKQKEIQELSLKLNQPYDQQLNKKI